MIGGGEGDSPPLACHLLLRRRRGDAVSEDPVVGPGVAPPICLSQVGDTLLSGMASTTGRGILSGRPEKIFQVE